MNVADASKYRAGMTITAYTSGNEASIVDHAISVISVSGNTLTIVPLTKNISSGTNVINNTILLSNAHGGLPALGIREMYINNLIIDGNENENTEAVSWRINYDIDVSNSRHFSITNSEFYNCPTNCITGGPSIYAANIKGKRILGSLFHQSNAGISNGTNQYGGGIYNSKHFTNIEIDDIGEKWVELEHDAAIFTASANTYDFFISDSRFTNVKSAFVEVGSSGGMYNINNVFVSASDLSTPHLIFGGISNVNYEEGKVKITNSGIYENI